MFMEDISDAELLGVWFPFRRCESGLAAGKVLLELCGTGKANENQ